MTIISTDTDSGIKFASTTARPAMLPTETPLGIRKKNTATETTAVPRVITVKSQIFAFIALTPA